MRERERGEEDSRRTKGLHTKRGIIFGERGINADVDGLIIKVERKETQKKSVNKKVFHLRMAKGKCIS